jgi:hypothetical protein
MRLVAPTPVRSITWCCSLRGHSLQSSPTHGVRLRVEIGQFSHSAAALAGVSATKRRFALAPRRAGEVVVLSRPGSASEQ